MAFLDETGLSHFWTAIKNKFYQMPEGGIPKSDLVKTVQTSLGKADTAYQKPSGGIPKDDLATAVKTSLGKADTAYQKPSGGIPKDDLATAVKTSLGNADSAYHLPSGGIPGTDLAETYVKLDDYTEAINSCVNVNGDSMLGNLSMGQHNLSDVRVLELDNGTKSVSMQVTNDGALDISGKKIIAAHPIGTGSGVVATKDYVDMAVSANEQQLKDDIADDIADAIGNALHLKKEVLTSGTLPAVSTASENVIYMLPVSGASGNNVYIEYMKINNKWEQIGSTDVDLSNYLTTDDVTAITNAEIDTIMNGAS